MSAGLYTGVSGLAVGAGLNRGVSGLWGGASGLIRGAGASVFTPAALFAAGEQGCWLDPSDFSTMFQDSAGTTPVTAVGQPVGRILDKSGRGNHATQASASLRPILQVDSTGRHFLLFDGTDDFLQTGTITPGIDKAQVFVGLRKESDAAPAILAETSPNAATNDGALYLAAPEDTGANGNYTFQARGSVALAPLASGTFLAPDTAVLTATVDIASSSRILRRNATQVGTSAAGLGTSNFLAYPLSIGRRAGTSLPFSGRIYSLILRFGANLSADRIAQTETFVNQRTGAF